jgi:hypothetical protein
MGSTRIVFSADQAAAALWTYAEDALAQRVLELTLDDMKQLWEIAGGYWREDHVLPLKGRLVLDKVTAFACIEFIEGGLRPLAQERRRPRKAMPDGLRHARPVPPDIVAG